MQHTLDIGIQIGFRLPADVKIDPPYGEHTCQQKRDKPLEKAYHTFIPVPEVRPVPADVL